MMKKIALILVFTISMCRLMAQLPQSQPGEEDFGKGLQLYNTGYYQLAATSLTEAIKENPRLYEAYLYLGNCYAFLHQFKEAEKNLKTASKHLKKNSKLEFSFGYMYNEMGSYKKAFAHLGKAVSLDPKDAISLNALGVSYQGMHDARKAIECYSGAIKIDSTLAIAYNNRGTAIYENQDIEAATSFDIKSAIKDLDHAIRIDPKLCVALRNRGMAYSFLNQNDMALKDLDAAIKCQNNNPTYYLNRGSLLTTMGRYKDAIADINYAIELNPKQPEAYILLGESYARAGGIQEAAIDEMKAEIMDKNYSGLANYNIARYYAMSKDKTLMMKYLALAKKAGYFKANENLAGFLKCPDFSNYKTDADFNKFRQSVRKNRM